MKYTPKDYQHHAIRWLMNRLVMHGKKGAMLLLDPGLGKTSITLSCIKALMSMKLIKKILIVAPLRVVYSVWRQEIAKWDQFKHLRCSIVHGPATKKMKALAADADIYLTNVENMEWIGSQYSFGKLPFQMCIADESSKFKTWGSGRTKALRKLVDRFRYRLCLTGTPCNNSLVHLFPQCYIADSGETFGKHVTKFEDKYFWRSDFRSRWTPHKGAREEIEEKMRDVALTLLAKDHLDMPALVINDVWVDLPDKCVNQYKTLEQAMFLALDEEGGHLTAKNAGAKYMLCKQFANGGVYEQGESGKIRDRKSVHLHEAKIDALEEIIDELNGKPVLIPFGYDHDLERLHARFKKRVEYINGKVSGSYAAKLIERWNNNDIELLAVQPKSLSHGINMQAGEGRDIVWIGLTDDAEDYGQLNARIFRQGVVGQVRVHRILTRGTVDEAVRERLEEKNGVQLSLMEALSKYRKEVV